MHVWTPKPPLSKNDRFNHGVSRLYNSTIDPVVLKKVYFTLCKREWDKTKTEDGCFKTIQFSQFDHRSSCAEKENLKCISLSVKENRISKGVKTQKKHICHLNLQSIYTYTIELYTPVALCSTFHPQVFKNLQVELHKAIVGGAAAFFL